MYQMAFPNFATALLTHILSLLDYPAELREYGVDAVHSSLRSLVSQGETWMIYSIMLCACMVL